jgi:methionyl-tRNA formyltransferase
MAGDAVTGVQVMRMEAGLDTGPVLASAETEIAFDDTAATVHDRLAQLGAPLLVDALAKLERGEARETPQAEAGVTYAHKVTPSEARIDWTQPARIIDRQIRGLAPAPGAWFEFNGARMNPQRCAFGGVRRRRAAIAERSARGSRGACSSGFPARAAGSSGGALKLVR